MDTLTSEQSRQFTRSQDIENFLTKNRDKVSLLKPFQNKLNLLSANNKKINSYIPDRSANGEGATTEKENLKLVIANSVNDICSLVIPYALDISDATLYNTVNVSTTDVIDLRNIAVLGFVTTLTGAVLPLLSRPDFADYPVTAEELDALTTNATTYHNSIGDNKMIDSAAAAASANIDTLLAANRLIIASLNKLINYYRKKDPDFVKDYHTAAALNNSGIHHSGLGGVVRNSTTNEPVGGVTLILKGKISLKSTLTGEDGAYAFAQFRPGKCKLTLTAPGYESLTVEVTIIRGKTLTINLALRSQAVSIHTA